MQKSHFLWNDPVAVIVRIIHRSMKLNIVIIMVLSSPGSNDHGVQVAITAAPNASQTTSPVSIFFQTTACPHPHPTAPTSGGKPAERKHEATHSASNPEEASKSRKISRQQAYYNSASEMPSTSMASSSRGLQMPLPNMAHPHMYPPSPMPHPVGLFPTPRFPFSPPYFMPGPNFYPPG